MLHHKYVDVGGDRVRVVVTGPGHAPAVLFLHGWPANWSIL